MQNSHTYAFMYENLKQIYVFNESTRLCVYEPTNKLFVIKSVALSCKAGYKALQSLNSPHLAKIYGVFEKKDCLEIVREYISGETLANLLKGDRFLPPEIAIKLTADICDGLSDMHRLGYVHRDITPNNIIVSSDGCAKIIDFGIARNFSQDKTKDTAILGTPGYAAPEQFGFSQSDARTDIYAVGVLLNVMLTGKLPHEQQVQGVLGKIIRKCMEIDSRQRYKTMEDLKKAVCNQRPDSSPITRVIKQIPGIRSQNPAVVIFAVIWYLLVLVFSMAIFSTVKNGAYLETILSWILCFGVPFFCFHNFLGIWDKLPFSKGASKQNQKIVYTVFGIASILFGCIIFGAINAP